MAQSTSPAANGLALVELLVAALVVAIGLATLFLVVGGARTTPIDRTCSHQAARFERGVTEYKSKHGAPPSATGRMKGTPNVYSDALTLEDDHDISGDSLDFTMYGTGASQWNYDARTGTVIPGKSCT